VAATYRELLARVVASAPRRILLPQVQRSRWGLDDSDCFFMGRRESWRLICQEHIDAHGGYADCAL
jgi:hypothetical protein